MGFGRKWKNWSKRSYTGFNSMGTIFHDPSGMSLRQLRSMREMVLNRLEALETTPRGPYRMESYAIEHAELDRDLDAIDAEIKRRGASPFGVSPRRHGNFGQANAGGYYVVGYYAGDVPRRDFRRHGPRPRGFVYGSFGTKAQAEKHAKFLQKKAGGQAAHTIYEAVPYERAVRMFDLRV